MRDWAEFGHPPTERLDDNRKLTLQYSRSRDRRSDGIMVECGVSDSSIEALPESPYHVKRPMKKKKPMRYNHSLQI